MAILEKLGFKQKRTQFLVYLGIFLFLFFSFNLFLNVEKVSAAESPEIFTYQGKILQGSSAVTTTIPIQFILYNDLTATDLSNILYVASGTPATASITSINITPTNGLFSIDLGGSETKTLYPSIFQNNATVYLELIVDGETMSPRKRINSVPYAFNSKYLDGIGINTVSTTVYIPKSGSDGSFEFNTTTISTLVVSGSGSFGGDVDMNGNKITELGSPTAGGDAATKDYVDSVAQGVTWYDPVEDKDLTVPPGAPTTGDRYVVATLATGAWSGEDNNMAEWNGVSWDFTISTTGATTYVIDESTQYNFNGTSWVSMGTTVAHNNTTGLQGGDTAEYYHLDASQHTTLTGVAGLDKTNESFIVGNGTSWANQTSSSVKAILDLNNVENTALSIWAGTTNLTTLGTITSGVWNGTTIDSAYITSSSEWNSTYLTVVASSSLWQSAYEIVNTSSTNWNTAYDIVNASSTYWDTAYGWGDHSLASYLTSYTETDPIWMAASSTYLTTTTASNTYLTIASDLSDLNSISTARTNLGLGALAILDTVNSTTIANGSIYPNHLSTTTGPEDNWLLQYSGGNFKWTSTGSLGISGGASLSGGLINTLSYWDSATTIASTSIYYSSSTGYLGIGTSALPTTMLAVVGTSTLQNVIPETNLTYTLGNTNSRWAEAWVQDLYIGISTWKIYQDSGDFKIKEEGDSVPALFIDDTNNFIGINTSSASEALTVGGAVKIGNSASSDPGTIRFLNDQFEGYTSGGGWVDLASSTGGGSSITGAGSAGQVVYWQDASTLAGNNDLYWDNSNGYFGVGTNAPGSAVDIIGTTTIRDTLKTDSGKFYSATAIAPLDSNLFTNPSVESGTTGWSSFQIYDLGFPGPWTIQTTSTAYDGSSAVIIEAPATTSIGIYQSITATVTNTISFYARTLDSGSDTVHVSIYDDASNCDGGGVFLFYNFTTLDWECADYKVILPTANAYSKHFVIDDAYTRYSVNIGNPTVTSSYNGSYNTFVSAGGSDASSTTTVMVDALQIETGTSATTFDDGIGGGTSPAFALQTSDAYSSWGSGVKLLSVIDQNDKEFFNVLGDGSANIGDSNTTGSLYINNVGSGYNFSVNSSGVVSVGDNTTTGTLAVYGGAGATSLYAGTNGYVGIGTSTPAYTLDVDGNINLTGNLLLSGINYSDYFISSTGTLGQVWRSDGDGAGAWTSTTSLGIVDNRVTTGDTIGQTTYWDGSTWTATTSLFVSSGGSYDGNIGIGDVTPEFKLSLDNDGGILALGTYDSGATLSASGAGAKLIWYPRKSAFRAGAALSSEWDESNIGIYSAAFGAGNKADGFASFVAGYANTASGTYSVALNNGNIASGEYSFAAGAGNEASGIGTFVTGFENIGSGLYGSVFGYDVTSTHNYALAVGYQSLDILLNPVGDSWLNVDTGNVGIGTSTPGEKLTVTGGVQIGNSTGTNTGTIRWTGTDFEGYSGSAWDSLTSGLATGIAGQTLVYDGSWTPTSTIFVTSTKVSIGTTTPDMKLTLDSDGGIIARGTFGSGSTLTTAGAGSRLLWYPRKSAFRVGTVSSDVWDDNNIGDYSIAMGVDATASQIYSVAIGAEVGATATGSVAIGVGGTTASGYFSTALGYDAVASGDYSVALGDSNAFGTRSMALGNAITASGEYSVGIGATSTAYTINQNNTIALMGDYIGVGTTTPGYKLTVSGDVNISGTYRINGTSISTVGDGSNTGEVLRWDGSDWVPTATSTMVLTDSGDIGIGTDSPSEKLHLSGGTFKTSIGSDEPTLISTYDTFVSVNDVVVVGKYAYVGDNTSVQIYDISDPNNPVMTGYYAPFVTLKDIYVAGKYLYAVDSGGGGTDLRVIDISDPGNPVSVGAYDLDFEFISIYVSGKYAYAGNSPDGIFILDILDPANITIVDSLTLSNVNDIYVSGDFLYSANATAGLRIIDISDPTNPTQTGTYNSPGTANGVYVSGRYAYLADDTSVQVVDISSSTNPTLVGTNGSSGADKIFVAGQYAYIANGTSGFQVFDISSSTAPTLETSYNTTGTVGDIYVSGKYLYVADGTAGLEIFDLHGADIHSAKIGSIESNVLNITNNLNVANDAYINNGLNVGSGGIMSNGAVGIYGSTTSTLASSLAVYNSAGSSTLYVRDDGKVGIGTTTPDMKLTLDSDGGILALGTHGSGATLSASGAGTRLLWYPKKSAFRAGAAGSTSWNEGNIGNYSAAFGNDNSASGSNSFAAGSFSTASGNASFAAGNTAVASGIASVAFGFNTTASGDSASAFGFNSTASNTAAVAMGNAAVAGGLASFAAGYQVEANGDYSAALGSKINVTGQDSVGIGLDHTGSYALSQNNTMSIMGGKVGIGTTTPDYDLTVIGQGHYKTSEWSKLILETDGVAAKVRQGSDQNGVSFTTNVYWSGTSWETDDTAKSKFAYIQHLGNSKMEFRVAKAGSVVDWNTAMVIEDDGEVGIGDETPDYLLDVAGTVGVDSYIYHNDDVDTYTLFDIDRFRVYAGGENLIDVFEGSQDYVKLGDGGDVDINLNDDLFVEGSSGKVGIGTTTPEMKLTLDNDGGILAVGELGSGSVLTTSGTGTRMIWYPRKGAFRAGSVGWMGVTDGSEWDETNVGTSSVAMGLNTLASGDFGATAFGYLTHATGDASFAGGAFSSSTGQYSTAFGWNGLSSGQGSFTAGHYNVASGLGSFATGQESVASGVTAVAIGYHNISSNSGSVAMGYNNISSGYGSTAFGSTSTASGSYSLASGGGVVASGTSSVAFGYLTNSTGQGSFVTGWDSDATGDYSTAFGYQNTASGTYSFTAGSDNVAGGNNSIALGESMTVSGDGSFGVGLDGLSYTVDDASVFAIMGGTVGIGTTTPSTTYVLEIVGDANAVGGSWKSDGSDYAEYFYTADIDLEPGEVVCVDVRNNNAVERCKVEADSNVMGIVSTHPSIIGNNTTDKINNPNYKIIGMLGQVPAKVSSENGKVRPGDSLTPASIPGYIMRANPGDSTVGVALETLDSEFGLINVLISRRNKSLTVEQVESKITDRIADMEIEDEVEILVSQAVHDYDFGPQFDQFIDPVNILIDTRFSTFADSINTRFNILENSLQNQTLDLNFNTTTVFKTILNEINEDGFVFDVQSSSTLNTKLLSIRHNDETVWSVDKTGNVNMTSGITANNLKIKNNNNSIANQVRISGEEVVEEGDILVVDKNNDKYYKLSDGQSEVVAGVVVNGPALLIGDDDNEYSASMALSGEVLVKASVENGNVKRGDLLVLASTTGHVMKYSLENNGLSAVGIVGIALQELNTSTGKISMLIRSGWMQTGVQTVSQVEQDLQNEIFLNDNLLSENYNSGDLNLNSSNLIGVSKIVSANNKWMITEDGEFVIKINTSDGERDLYALNSFNKEFVFSSSSALVNGEAVVEFEQSIKDIIDESELIKVSITLTSGEAVGIYVSEKSASGFTVRELQNGTSNASFDWVVMATRKEYEEDEVVVEDIINDVGDIIIENDIADEEISTSTEEVVGGEVVTTSTEEVVAETTTEDEVSAEPLGEVSLDNENDEVVSDPEEINPVVEQVEENTEPVIVEETEVVAVEDSSVAEPVSSEDVI